MNGCASTKKQRREIHPVGRQQVADWRQSHKCSTAPSARPRVLFCPLLGRDGSSAYAPSQRSAQGVRLGRATAHNPLSTYLENAVDKKPDRTQGKKPRSQNGTVAEIGLKGAINALPGGSVLTDLIKARREELSEAMRCEGEKRLDAFYSAMLSADVTMKEAVARAMLDDTDFHALLRACLADIESEKVTAYAALARKIATGAVPKEWRRHFVLALRDLSADELACMRKACVAREHKLIPAQGPSMGEDHFLSPGRPGTRQSIMIGNLVARGFAHEGKLSDLGVKFTKACWRAEDLTAGSIGYREWSGHNVAIVSYEIGDRRQDELARNLEDALRATCVKSFTLAVMRDNHQQVRMNATLAVLLVGNKIERIETYAEPLKAFAAKVPMLVVTSAPDSQLPGGLRTFGEITAANRTDTEVVSEVCRALGSVSRKEAGTSVRS